MPTTAETLSLHGTAYKKRLEKLANLAVAWVPRFGSVKLVNDILAKNDRNDLRMTKAIGLPQLTSIPNPANHNHVGNFGLRFGIFISTRMVTVHGSLDDYEEKEVIPMDIPALQEIRIKGLPASYHGSSNHLDTPAFHRAMVLLPGFMINMAVDISSNEQPLPLFGPEVLLAHALMSRVVDIADQSALKSDGSVNSGYLCANHAEMSPQATS